MKKIFYFCIIILVAAVSCRKTAPPEIPYPSPAITQSQTPLFLNSATQTPVESYTFVNTQTMEASASATPQPSYSASESPTPPASLSQTETFTMEPSATGTEAPASSVTVSSTCTSTATVNYPSFTCTSTITRTYTVTSTLSMIFTPTVTQTHGGYLWIQGNAAAAFTKRSLSAGLVYNGEMWLISGTGADGTGMVLKDAWHSSNGVDWFCATRNAQFPERCGSSAVEFNGKIWIIAGSTGVSYNYYNDVWFSSDGMDWYAATRNAVFAARGYHQCLTYAGKMWVIGGNKTVGFIPLGDEPMNDVWYSVDGIDWNLATGNAEFSPRSRFAALVFDGKMWVIGGAGNFPADYNDAWWSTDGIVWNCATAAAAYYPGFTESAVVYDNQMWLINTWKSGNLVRDIWYSYDGADWNAATLNAEFSDRIGASVFSYGGKIWMTGGMIGLLTVKNDTWYTQ